MKRRQVLAAFGALLSAGCLGAERPDSSGGVRTEGAVTNRTATPTATPEPTDTPTATPEPGPSEEEIEAGEEAISTVQSEFGAAVEAYTGDDDGELIEVSITNTEFDVRQVLLALDSVQRALVDAEEAAVTDDQTETVADLRVAEAFLTQSALVHSYFVECVDRLDATHDAFSEDLDEVESAESRFDATLERGSEGVSTLKNDIEADPIEVAEPFDDDTYDDTVSAFDSVRSVFEDASSGLDRMTQGIDELEQARDDEDDGDDDDAEDASDEARDLFDEAYDFFDDAADAAGDADADDLESLLEDLRDVADDRYSAADDLHDDVS
ncbi:hypothetical protein [Salinigranum sp. GCM10025319]|uniref:hypothetical protein n=1 Tax=Salinigranum sp. GCM10025319 TaxID=3252687 RepID=UPI0036175EF3